MKEQNKCTPTCRLALNDLNWWAHVSNHGQRDAVALFSREQNRASLGLERHEWSSCFLSAAVTVGAWGANRDVNYQVESNSERKIDTAAYLVSDVHRIVSGKCRFSDCTTVERLILTRRWQFGLRVFCQVPCDQSINFNSTQVTVIISNKCHVCSTSLIAHNKDEMKRKSDD